MLSNTLCNPANSAPARMTWCARAVRPQPVDDAPFLGASGEEGVAGEKYESNHWSDDAALVDGRAVCGGRGGREFCVGRVGLGVDGRLELVRAVVVVRVGGWRMGMARGGGRRCEEVGAEQRAEAAS